MRHKKLLIGAVAAGILVGGFVAVGLGLGTEDLYSTLCVYTLGLAGLLVTGHTATDVLANLRRSPSEAPPRPADVLE